MADAVPSRPNKERNIAFVTVEDTLPSGAKRIRRLSPEDPDAVAYAAKIREAEAAEEARVKAEAEKERKAFEAKARKEAKEAAEKEVAERLKREEASKGASK